MTFGGLHKIYKCSNATMIKHYILCNNKKNIQIKYKWYQREQKKKIQQKKEVK